MHAITFYNNFTFVECYRTLGDLSVDLGILNEYILYLLEIVTPIVKQIYVFINHLLKQLNVS